MTQLASFTYDPATDIGRVRLLAFDYDEAQPTFSDPEIQAFLDLNDGEVKMAAAQAIEQGATRLAFVMRVVTMLDSKLDGAATARSLRELASELRRQVREDDAAFDIAEWVTDPFSWRDRLLSQFQRYR